MDEAVRRWKPRGQVFFWHDADRRQGDGWHMAADPAGCDDLDDVGRIAGAADFPSRFTLGRPPGFAALTISFDRSRPADHWRLTKGDPATLELGQARLDDLSGVVADLRAGKGDYTFGPDDPEQSIWIWWPPRQG